MRKPVCNFLTALILTLPGNNIFAQATKGNAVFDHITTENGLSSNDVTCIYQDSRGLMWFGTSNGLNRYDGIQVLQLFHQPDNLRNSLPGNHILTITEDKQGRLWIGTTEGVTCYNPITNTCTNYLNSVTDFDALHPTMFYVTVTSDGNIWVATDRHLTLLDTAGKKNSHYKIDVGEQLPFSRNFIIRTPFEDSKKRLWLPSSYGVKLFDRAGKKAISYHYKEVSKSLPENFTVFVKESPDGQIIAGSWGGGLHIFNESKQRFEALTLGQYSQPGTSESMRQQVFDILFDKEKVLLATGYGLLELAKDDMKPGTCAQFKNYLPETGNNRSLSSFIVWSLLKDTQGTVWLAETGVSKIDAQKQQFKTSQFYPTNKQQLNFSSLIFSGDKMLLGADDAYWYKDGQLLSLQLKKSLLQNTDGQIWDMADGKNAYWLASTNGLIQLSKTGAPIAHYKHKDGDSTTIAGERIWKVYEDREGLVWISTVRRGMSVLNPKTGKIKNYFAHFGEPNSLYNGFTTPLFEDSKGNIWFGSLENKLFFFNKSTNQFSVYTIQITNDKPLLGTVSPFWQDTAGHIWLSTRKGICMFNPASGQTVIMATHPDFVQKKDIAVHANSIWILTNNSLLQYDLQTKTFKRFTTQDGLYTTQDADVIKISPSGGLVLSGAKFISFYNPQAHTANTLQPPIIITKILANGKDSLFPGNSNELSYLSAIEFHFATLSYTNVNQNKYQYRLIGANDKWSEVSGEHSVSFARLPPGHYTFEVKGCNASGIWSSEAATFSFTIKRPFYKSFWFYTLLAFVLGAAIYAFYRYRLRKALELEKMRTRIATDLHDDIGATLSSISMYSETLKAQVKDTLPHLEPVLNKMGENSREMVTGMSDIVWAINPQNDTGEKLLQRMENYATDMCAAKNIVLNFTADEKLHEMNLPLEHRKNIYLIFKEAVNNAVKYSGAGVLDIILTQNGKTLCLTIKDNGTGFDEKTIKKGNGLVNMQLRAAEIHGSLEIISEKGIGTRVVFKTT